MGEFLLAFVIFAVVILVTALLFGGWLIINIARGIGALIGTHPRPLNRPTARRVQSGGVIQCRVPGCRHFNPAGARFCRHCGHAFPKFQTLAA